MALFLSESLSAQNTYKGNYIDLLIEQSEIQSELNTLNEAIYQADFIIHEQSRTLSESAAQVLQENFLANAWEKIKAFVRKAIQWVKDFAKKVKDKVVELYNRIKDRIKGDAVEIAKGKFATMEDAIKFNEQNAKLMEKLSGQTNKTVIDSIKEQGVKLKADFDKKKESNAKMTGTQKVSFTYFDKIVKASQMNEQVSEKVARDFEGEIKALEAKHKDELAAANAATRDAKEDSRNNSDLARNTSSALQAERDAHQKTKSAHRETQSTLDQTFALNQRLSDANDKTVAKAKGIIGTLQEEIAGLKQALAVQMELSRAAGAAMVAVAGAATAAHENSGKEEEGETPTIEFTAGNKVALKAAGKRLAAGKPV